ncbi:queuine tRNA-ribosyltransferase catalytic subunit isoform X2 [Cephus cinctus]|uniref:Queuine tRNA-ribosyltransferase catalytic subunit 1 n=2 Tax=Cephus cinctus TaxID=211228 RepID=A0AAJ7W1W7_CEPCN|nr:queuine tRNA-ribosyltransferase catalytic subunit isoform X2 [Cephus cinctus]
MYLHSAYGLWNFMCFGLKYDKLCDKYPDYEKNNIQMSEKRPALIFKVITECQTTKARVGKMTVPHHTVDTPVFMPVGTKGIDILQKAGGLHKFMNWDRALLTDSGGFQMVSLLKFAEINEQGVKFISPYDDSECMLTPEYSIKIQNTIGADIIMQLDDVIKTTTTGTRVEEAMHRTTRWLDRCLSTHQKPNEQSIFPIMQGGLNAELRSESGLQLTQRKVNGYAIGGLSGGESKDDFWKMVNVSTNILPKDKPRYLMGVGFAVDLIVCSALGVDMFDCVFPTRTARFGCALVLTGQLNLKQGQYGNDTAPIDEFCNCSTCKTYSRAYLHQIVTMETVGCHLLSVHNIAFQMRLMQNIRESIKKGEFPQFVQQFMLKVYPTKEYPSWIVDALQAVNIYLA